MKNLKKKSIFSIFIAILIGIFFVSYNSLIKNNFNQNLKVDNSKIKDPSPPRIDKVLKKGDSPETVKAAIINMPNADKYIGFETVPNTAYSGTHTVTLVAVWADNTVKKYNITYKVIKEQWVKPSITVDIANQTVKEGDNITPVHWTLGNVETREYSTVSPAGSTNVDSYFVNKANPVVANYILNPNGLTYTPYTTGGTQGTLSGKVNIKWKNNEEEQRVIEVNNYTIFEQNEEFNESISRITVNRDTDKDGTIDSEDDDDDDDGYTDQQEILYGSNPKDRTSKPNQAAMYKVNVLQKKTLKYYVNDTPNIIDGITSDKTLDNANKIKAVRVKDNILTDEKGEKIGKVEIEFEDCSTLEVEVVVKVFEKELIAPKLLVNKNSQEILETKEITDIIFTKETVDTTGSEYLDKIIDEIVSQKLTVKSDVLPVSPSDTVKEKTIIKDYSTPVNADELIKFDGTDLYSKTQWGNKERATFTLKAEIVYRNLGSVTKESTVTLLRDTDRDGDADEVDDDDDDDGVSDADEIRLGYDSKDPNSKPTEAELHGNEVTTKEFVVYENDQVDILGGIVTMPLGATKEIEENVDTTEKGLKQGKVKVKFKDDSTKTYIIPVKVYKKIFVAPTVEMVSNTNGNEVIENQNILPIKYNIKWTTPFAKNHEEYTETFKDLPQNTEVIVNQLPFVANITGLNKNVESENVVTVNGKMITEKVNLTTERINVNVELKVTTEHGAEVKAKTSNFVLLRDLDRDGNPDERDDDDDGDEVSDADEIRTHHDPKNPDDKPTKAELDQTEIKTKVLKTYVNEAIDLKNGIVTKPANTTLEVIEDVDYTEKGSKEGKVKVKFDDGSFKEVKVKVNVFEKVYVKPTVTLTPEEQNVLESNNIAEVTLAKTTVSGRVDNDTFMEYIVDNVVSENFLDLSGLTFNNNKLKGKLNVTWANNQEENKTITLTNKIKYEHLSDTDTTVKFNVDRDTDSDGTKDSEDDDDDDDGFTDQEEIDNNSNPKDSSSIPTQAAVYKLRQLRTKKLKAYVADVVNLKEGITSALTGHNINKVEITQNTDTTAKGDDKPGTVRITFDDNSFLDVKILTDVYQKQYIKGSLVVNPETQTAIEKKHINQITFQVNKVGGRVDDDENIEYIPDEILTNEIELENGSDLTVTDITNTLTVGKLVSGIPTVTWPDNVLERKTVKVINKVNYKNLGEERKESLIEILRDTDSDGTPDTLDEDDDDDDYSDDEEIAAHTDPKDANSKPTAASRGVVVTKVLTGYVDEDLDEKLAIKSKPENTTVDVISEFDTSSKGEKEAVLRINYQDGSTKNYTVKANIFEKQYLIHDVTIDNNNQRVTESKNITAINVNKTINGTPGVDLDQYIEKIIDTLDQESYDNLYNLENNSNVLTGKVNITDWQAEEETKTITINYIRKYAHSAQLTNPITITVDRDTDKDGTPDKDDDDDDGDGVSDDDEKRTHHNPKDASDKPTKKELDQTVINVNNNLETFVNVAIDIKTAITNKPANTTVNIKTPVEFSSKGAKTGVLELVYDDNSKKEFNVVVKVYEKEYVKPTVTVTNNNTNVLEGNAIETIKFNKSAVSLDTDEVNFIKKELDVVLSEDIVITGANLNKSTDEVTGIPTVTWNGNEETKTVTVKKEITYKNLAKTEVSAVFVVDRDTDSDGTKDSDDDDDDGDGVIDTDEIRTNHDPKNPADKPTEKELDQTVITTNTLEAYVGDTVDLTTAITSKPLNTTLEIETPVVTTSKGLKQGVVKVKYQDNSFKNVTVNVKVFEKEYVKPTITVTNTNVKVIDKKAIEEITFNKVNPTLGKNETTFVEKVLDIETTNNVDNLNNLTYSDDKISGIVKINNWVGKEEKKTITLKNTRTYTNLGPTTVTTTLEVNRDTDSDGTIDSEDDDDDGDGVSDADEIRTHHDPKDPADKPQQNELTTGDITTQVLEAYVDDTVDIKTAITAKPANTTLEVETPIQTDTKGLKEGVVKVKYQDGSSKKVTVNVKVFEKQYVKPTITVNNTNTKVVDRKAIEEITFNVANPVVGKDQEQYVETFIDQELTNTINSVNNLTYTSNKITGSIVINNWVGQEEKKTITLTNTRTYANSSDTNTTVTLEVNRDTDSDGRIDSEDDDDDGDGVSDADEIRTNHDPKNPADKPTKAELDQTVITTNILEAYIGDTVDIKTAITAKPENTTLEVETPVVTTAKGLKQGVVKVKYQDGSSKSITVKVKVFEKQYVKPTITVNNPNTKIIDKKAIEEITFNVVNPTLTKNEEQFIIQVLDTENANTVNNLTNLTYSDNKLSGIIKVNNWVGQEEKKTITLTNNRKYDNSSDTNTTVTLEVNRDTDSDGTIDSEDDDDDGDGISDEIEKKTHHNPKDPTDKPSQNELDTAEITTMVLSTEMDQPVDLLLAITSRPANTTVRVKTPVTTSTKGEKTGVVEVIYPDNSKKQVNVKVKVYEVRYLTPEIEITNPNTEVLEDKNISEVNIKVKEVEERVDETNFIKYKKDELLSENITNLNGLTNTSNNKLSGKFNYTFTGTDEIKTMDILYTRNYRNSPSVTKTIKIKLLRDTDKDGIPDKDDDDKDGDGFTNAQEIARGSDPYNKDSIPTLTKKEQLDLLIKKLEKLIEDTKNNNFDNKNKIDVDRLKDVTLPDKEDKKNQIKNSYNDTTPEIDIENKKKEVQKLIDDINDEVNKLRDRANFTELDKEIAKEIEDIYTKDSLKTLKDKIKEAKNIARDKATQQEVDNMTKAIKELRDKLVIDKTKLKEQLDKLGKAIDSGKCLSKQCKDIYDKAKIAYDNTNLTKEEYLAIIKEINAVLEKNHNIKNPKTSSSQFIIVILASIILVVGYVVVKSKKSYIR